MADNPTFTFVQRLDNHTNRGISCFCSLENGVVIVGTYGSVNEPCGVYRSTDYGQTFTFIQQLSDSMTHVSSLAYLGNGVVLAGTRGDEGILYRSIDYGLTFAPIMVLSDPYTQQNSFWTILSLGSGIAIVYTMEMISGAPDRHTLYRTIDYGLTYSVVDQALESSQVPSVAIWAVVSCVLDNGVVLIVSSWDQIWRSTDSGQTFSLVATIPGIDWITSMVDAGNGVIVLGTGYFGKTYRSTDYGQTFTFIQQLELQQEAIDAGDVLEIEALVFMGNGIILAGANTDNYGSWIYISTDSGLTFSYLQKLESWSEDYPWVGGEIKAMVSLGNGVGLTGTDLRSNVYRINFGEEPDVFQIIYTAPQHIEYSKVRLVFTNGSEDAVYLKAAITSETVPTDTDIVENSVLVAPLDGAYSRVFILSSSESLMIATNNQSTYLDGTYPVGYRAEEELFFESDMI